MQTAQQKETQPSPATRTLDVRHYDPGIRYLALRFRSSRVPFNELMHEGRIALWRASQTWRDDGGASLATYARKFIFAAMVRCVSERAQEGLHGDGVDEVNEGASTASLAELRLLVVECLDMLNERKRTIVALYMEGLTFKEISKAVGESERNVWRLFQSAIETLRERTK